MNEEQHRKDLEIPCPACHAPTGVECDEKTRLVCFGRRVKRLVIEKRPDLLDPPS